MHRHRARLAISGLLIAMVSLGVVLEGGTAVAHPKVYETVRVHIALTAEKAADGTLTERVIFTASNPRCFTAKSLKTKSDSKYVDVYKGAGGDLGFNNFNGIAEPPNGGWLLASPSSKYDQSPYIFEGVFPGNEAIRVEEPINSNHTYVTTISAATNASLEGRYPHFTETPYEVKFTAGGKRHIIRCSRAGKTRIIGI
ncbi:MAG TPA: hypothetical protein VHZ54_14610 [Solirubrobacterales bacterium]|nr:hypothetical protein [Solirubrobacterales bacterium]